MSTDTSGQDLRDLREEADLDAKELATHMRVHPSRISQIEALARVTPRAERRYRAALAASQLAKTTDERAEAAS